MDLYTPGVPLAAARITKLCRQADQQRLANRLPGRTAHRQGPRALGPPRRPGRHVPAADGAGGSRQAALHGLLAKVGDLGQPLLEVRRTDPDRPSSCREGNLVNPLLVPIVAAQGMWMRSTIRLVSPAAGPTSGTVGDPSRPPVRIAVVGESTAAGCGVDTHDNGFPGWLAREVAARTRRPVRWEVVGQFGATARRIRYRLLPRLGENLNVAVLLAGGNDVLTRRPPEQWREDLAAILDDLTDRAEQVVVTGVPPFAAFPSLPSTLGRYLAQRASALDAVSRQVCAERSRTTWISSTDILPIGPDFFAQDRFHPSAPGYRRWAQAVADHLAL